MKNENKKASYEDVYQSLREKILHLELPPGSAISETEIALAYEVSRTPVRDAFKALVNDKLLVIKPHIGTFVSLINLDQVTDTLYLRGIMDKAVLTELARTFDPSHAIRINLVLQQQGALLEQKMTPEELSRAFIISDNDFHASLYEAAGRKNLLNMFCMISSEYERFRTFLNLGDKANIVELYDEHCAILNALANHEEEKVADLVHHHLYDGFSKSNSVIVHHPEYFM